MKAFLIYICDVHIYIINKIIAIHLIVHDYGLGRVIASIHAGVSQPLDIMDIHSGIDGIEQRVENQPGINIVIHMDPVKETPQKAPGNTGSVPEDTDRAE